MTKLLFHLPMKVNYAIVANFYVANMSFNAIRENKIFAEISEFTVDNLHSCFRVSFMDVAKSHVQKFTFSVKSRQLELSLSCKSVHNQVK